MVHHIWIENTKSWPTWVIGKKIKICEANEIEQNDNNLNKQHGLKIGEALKPIFHKLKD